MNKFLKLVNATVIISILATIFSLTGCSKEENTSEQAAYETQVERSVAQQEHTEVQTMAQQELTEVQTVADAIQLPEDTQEQSQIALSTNYKTQAEWDEIARKERTALEERVKMADGISEDKAVEIAQKALETDLGATAKELILTIDETFGWKSDLCIADWSEIKEKDRGTLAYSINYNNGQKVTDFKDLINYNCVVNAVDGSILEAYSSQGFDDAPVYYPH